LEAEGFSVACACLDVERERDAYAGGDWLERTLARLCDGVRLAVGVTSVTPEFDRAVTVLETVKRLRPNLRTLIGGTHVTYLDEEPARHPAIDVVVRGEGEAIACEIARRWRDVLPIDDVKGVTVFHEGRIVRNASPPLINLKTAPIPAYHLIDEFSRDRVKLTPTYTRGCPYGCSYCVESIFFERRVRHKDPVRFVDELEIIAERFGWRGIHIADSTFGIDRKATAALCDELEKRRLNALFSINVRPNLFSYLGEELVARLVSLGFVEFYLGAETADDDLIKALQRRQSFGELMDCLTRLKALGVPFVKLYLMVGIPGDTHEGLQKTINSVRLMIREDLIFYATAKFFVPTPGTEPYAQFQVPEGPGQAGSWSRYERYNYPPWYPHDELTPMDLDHYLCLIQSVQLREYLGKLGRKPSEMTSRARDWAAEAYLKKQYM
ncbi:MAG: radical SAM protein, partial [Phenylobacterium sp.]|nr:radical SAM protein [Phenylobacterium sp.]